MSRDSSRTYIHLHSPHHADLFEHFTNPHFPSSSTSTRDAASFAHAASSAGTTQTHLPGTSTLAAAAHQTHLTSATTHASTTHLPHEDVLVPPHLQPPNPEDEDDVVPDQHAAFGITRAMAGREGRERQWRDFDSLRAVVRGDGLEDGVGPGGVQGARVFGGGASANATRSMMPR